MPHHHRSPEEYIRPADRLLLGSYCTRDRDTFAAGVYHHQKALAGTVDGQRVQLELVPEPGNKWDRLAVALDLDGERIGYIHTESAKMWHDVVRAWNRAGFTLYLPAQINRWGKREKNVGVTVHGITWDDLDMLARAAGLDRDAAALRARLTPEAHAGVFEDRGYTPAKVSLRQMRDLRPDFPQFTWQGKRAGLDMVERAPFWLGYFARDELSLAKQRKALLARVKRKIKTAITAHERAEREARRTAYLQHAPRALELHRAGMSKRAIAAELAITEHQVTKLVAGPQAQEPAASTWHAAAQQERLEAAREALDLQRQGLTRPEICERMGRSVESVKQLLSDAKFYESPTAFPVRHELALRCIQMRKDGMAKGEVLAALGVGGLAGPRAYRDAAVLETLPTA